jgi:NADPH:quinone reductase-like Zn-dependent oxidoreductase
VDGTGKLDMLHAIGANQVIDYTQEDFTRRRASYDVIFDVVGKASFSRSVRLLAPKGRYLMGNARPSQLLRGRWLAQGSSKQVVSWASRTAGEYAQDFNFLKELIEAGKIKSIIDRCYPLEEAAEAHRYVDTGRKKGHVVITVADSAGS